MKDSPTHDHEHDHTKIRTKDATVNVADLQDNVKKFYFELEAGLKNYYPEGDYELLVTSGKRNASDKKGAYYKTSRHNTGEALDLRANEKVYNYLYNTKEGLGIMVNNGMGLLDETNKEALAKTKGTAPHLHMGYDSNLVKKAKQRFEEKDESFHHINMGGTQGEVIPAKNSSGTNDTFVIKKGAEGFIVTDVVEAPFNYLAEDFKKTVEKTKNTEEKIEKSEDRQELEKLKKEEKKKEAFTKAIQENIVKQRVKKQEQDVFKEQTFDPITVQQSMPELPTIFKTLP